MISLAGLAFAVGMVVEGAIVVSGNILRLKEGGMTPHDAAFKGTHQVVGALIASTITTVAVFLPVVFLRDVEGQIFADLALTISIAVAHLGHRRDHGDARGGRLAQGEETRSPATATAGRG